LDEGDAAAFEEAGDDDDGGDEDAAAAGAGSSSSSAAAAGGGGKAPKAKSAKELFRGAFKPSGGDGLLSKELLALRKERLGQLAEIRNRAAAELAPYRDDPTHPSALGIRTKYLAAQVDLYTQAKRASAAAAAAKASSSASGAAAGKGAGSSSSAAAAGGGGSRRGKGHAMDARDEADELAEEAGGGSHGGGPLTTVKLTAQPRILQNGTMREYQLEGLNWMIALHDGNMSGILADVRSSSMGMRLAVVRARADEVVSPSR
jgi:hypothetical protein